LKKFEKYEKYKDSGIEWIGEIPEDWEVKKLKYFVSINQNNLNENTNNSFIIKYIDISSVGFNFLKEKPKELRFSEAPSRARRIAKKGDTIISTVRTYLKSMCFIDENIDNCIVSTGFAVLSPKNEIFPEILNFILASDYFINEVTKYSIGISYPAISENALSEIRIVIPKDLKEQNKIAKHLNKKQKQANTFTEKQKKIIELLKEQKKAIINEAVTKGIKNDVKMKNSGVEWIGNIPKGWEVISLKQLINKSDYGLSNSAEDSGPYKYLNMGNIQNGKVYYETTNHLKNIDEFYLLDYNDILFNRTNSLDLVGKCGIFKGKRTDKVTYASYLVRFKCNDKVISDYLNMILNSSIFLSYARSHAYMSLNQANLNPNRFLCLKIPIPNISTQKEILSNLEKQINKIDTLITNKERMIDKTDELLSSQIFSVISGKIII
jgi:restriction endonuclease S subunit